VDRGLDYSAGVPGTATILADGYTFVIRYVDDPNEQFGTKHVDPGEYLALRSAGVDVYLVFEIGTNDFTGGFLSGVEYATRALAGAQWVGYDGIVFASVDTHLADGQLPTALEYIDGFIHVLGNARTGVYGFIEIIDACTASGRGVAWWQCGHQPVLGSATQLWQDNRPSGTVTVGGISCDVNWMLKPLGAGDMTPEESQMLSDVHAQLCSPLPAWGGGVTDDQDTPYNMFQYLLRNNVEIHQSLQKLDSFSVGEAGDFGAISDADVSRIATEVIRQLSAKFQ
jgi:hypothetical protein